MPLNKEIKPNLIIFIPQINEIEQAGLSTRMTTKKFKPIAIVSWKSVME